MFYMVILFCFGIYTRYLKSIEVYDETVKPLSFALEARVMNRNNLIIAHLNADDVVFCSYRKRLISRKALEGCLNKLQDSNLQPASCQFVALRLPTELSDDLVLTIHTQKKCFDVASWVTQSL